MPTLDGKHMTGSQQKEGSTLTGSERVTNSSTLPSKSIVFPLQLTLGIVMVSHEVLQHLVDRLIVS